LPALSEMVHRSEFDQNEGPFFVRVVGPLHSVLLVVAPEDWAGETNVLGGDEGKVGNSWLRIPKDSRSEFILASTQLPDGSILQVGRSTNRSETLLGPFLTSFFFVIASSGPRGRIGFRSSRNGAGSGDDGDCAHDH